MERFGLNCMDHFEFNDLDGFWPIVEWNGQIDIAEIISKLKDLEHRPGRPVGIWDFSNSDLSLLGADETYLFIKYLEFHGEAYQGGKLAFVAPLEMNETFANRIAQMADRFSIRIVLFERQADAIKWLTSV